VDAYLDAGGSEVDYIPETLRTDNVYTRLLENDPSIVTRLPKRFQTYQAYYNSVNYCWSTLGNNPEDQIDRDMVLLALKKGDVRVYKDIPVKLRTAEVTLFALSRWHGEFSNWPFFTVDHFLSMVPAAAKTNEVLETAYNIMKQEKPEFPLIAFSHVGETTDKKMNAYIAEHYPAPATQKSTTLPEKKGEPSDENLSALYQSLYEMNLDGAEEDYLEYYESNYTPERVLSAGEDRAAIIGHLQYLMKELYNDLGDENTLKEWFIDAGGTETLYQEIYAD